VGISARRSAEIGHPRARNRSGAGRRRWAAAFVAGLRGGQSRRAGQPADPAHAPGYVVPGRDVQVTRIVLQDGIERSRETWYSHYAPVWGGPAR